MMSPHTARLLGGLRLAICVLAGLGISFALDWPKPEWAAIASIVMNLPYLGASVDRGITRMIGTVAGAFIGMWLVTLFAEHQLMFLPAVFVFATWAMYMGQGNRYPYSYMLGAVTALIVALPAMNAGASAPSEVWENALFRTLETCLGITVSIVVNAVIFPNYAGARLRGLLGESLDACENLLGQLLPEQLAARQSSLPHAHVLRKTAGQLLDVGPLFNFAMRDTSAVRLRRTAYEATFADARALLAAIGELHLGHSPPPPGPGTERLAPLLTRLGGIVGGEIRALREGWREGRDVFPPQADFAAADAAFLEAYDTARHSIAHSPELIRLMGARTALNDAWAALAALRRSLAAANGPAYLQKQLPATPPDPAPSGSARYQRLQLAIKAALGVTIGSSAILFTNAPGGMALAVAALFFVVINILVRYQPSFVIVVSMLSGSALAGVMLYWVFPHIDGNLWGLMAVMAPVLFFWGWLSGNPRYMGVSIMGCVLFVYCIDPLEHQTYSLMNYASFAVGQVLGTTLAALCLIIPWPRYPQSELRRVLAHFWECAAEMLETLGLPGPWDDGRLERLRALEHRLIVMPNLAAAWLADLAPRNFPEGQRERLLAHIAAAQSLALQLRGVARARAGVADIPLYHALSPEIAALNAACRAEMDALGVAFAEGENPRPAQDLLPVSRAISDRIEVERAAGRTFVYSAAVIGTLAALIARAQDITRDLLAAREALQPGDAPALSRLYFL